MKLGISGEWIGTRAGGLETYSLNLIQSLARSCSKHRYLIYTAYRDALSQLNGARNNLSVRYLGSASRWLAIPLLFPIRLFLDKVDLFHATSIAPPFCPAKLVVTVHDLGFVRHAEFYPAPVRYRLNRLISSGIKRARRIIAVSEYTKRDIMDYYGVEEGKISVVYEGVNSSYRVMANPCEAAPILERHRIPDNFVLYVGRFHEGKNLIRMLQAFSAARRKGNTKHKLVLVGRELFNAKPIYQEISRLKLESEVVLPGYVSAQDLPFIYGRASVFIYPSYFEGFGLPPLEAMACGTPVIVSSATSLPEVVGNAALLADPYSVEQMTDNLHRILTDGDLQAELRRRGLERAKQFTWEDAAVKTLEVYEQAAS